MTPEKKIEYVKKKIDEIAQISPRGPVHIQLYTLTEYEDGPIILSRYEQKTIIKKLEEDGYIKNVFFQDDGVGVLVEIVSKQTEKEITSVPKNQPIIKLKSLELIAKEIGELDSGQNLIEFLTGCGMDINLIKYPQTKWRMIYDVLLYYASCPKAEDRKMLLKIIEEASHPLMHNGDKKAAEETVKKFNGFLQYNNFFIENGVLWAGEPNGSETAWFDKNGNNYEDTLEVFLTVPKQANKLYVYWNELIKLTKFYFNNKDIQNEEINDVYFEIIKKVEDIIFFQKGCEILREEYKRPFGSLTGCEFEIQKMGLTQDAILVKLYDFLGGITSHSLPDKYTIEGIKKEDIYFFTRMIKYGGKKPEKTSAVQELKNKKQEPIPIILVNEIGIKGLEKGLEAISKTNKENDKPKFPYKLPAGTKWENITIKFEYNENVFIKAKRFEHYTNYKDMGFIGKGNNPEPSEAWVFLRVLSMAKIVGEIVISDQTAKEKYKKQKEFLTEGLQSYFSIDYDPFYPYRSSTEKVGSSYKIKLTLVPPPEQEEDKSDKKDEVKEYLNEQAPQVYDE
ncbi:hypothetical protein KKH26_00275 [Patescibacteria group bacterium]|nr:hypothetical protein [Patescibacteria group bacterium]